MQRLKKTTSWMVSLREIWDQLYQILIDIWGFVHTVSQNATRVHLTLEQTIKMIEKSELQGFNHNKSSEKYGVSKPTIASILKPLNSQILKTFLENNTY